MNRLVHKDFHTVSIPVLLVANHGTFQNIVWRVVDMLSGTINSYLFGI